MSENQELTNLIGNLAMDTNAISLVLIHLVAREAKTAPDSAAWLREFADEVMSSVDAAPNPPPQIQAKIELFRSRLDGIFNAVRLRIAE
jgi:hypothetical protein